MIERFYVHNFRCLENFDLPISGKSSSLLVGKNGTGKSTIGFVFEILQKIALGTSRVGSLIKPSDFSRDRSDIPLRMEIDVNLSGSIFQYALAFELPPGFKEIRILEEKLSRDGSSVYSRDKANVTLRKSGGNKETGFSVDWHLIALPIIQVQSDSDPIHIFKQWLGRMLILSPIPNQISGDSEGETIVPNRSVSDFGDWFSGVLRHSPASYAVLDKFLKNIMPDYKEIKNIATGANSKTLSVQFQQDDAYLTIPFQRLSDGEKCYFIGAVALAFLDVFGPSFCFWDEPDNHLSLSEVGHFVMALRRAFQSAGQLVITSHNPEAIRRFSIENTLCLHRCNHLEPVTVRPADKLPINGDLVDTLIRDDL
jgi:energy-coupling factor transporter ATP-binding protein EcfA2